MNINKKHKDSLFSFLFSNPEVLRELYSAITGVTVAPDISIDINTLTDVLYGVGSQYSSHYHGTWCIQHYYR
jgi:hypothetical protein